MTAGLIRLLTGVQARWVGIDPVRPDGTAPQRIYVANHTSHLDAPVIWAALPKVLRERTCPVAARDYWERTPVRRYLAGRVFKAVLIEREKVTARSNPLIPMDEALATGRSLILFPEGTRGADEDGGISAFKPGLWHLAKGHPHVQLVPVYLENLNRMLPKGEMLAVPLLAAAVFGAPIGRIEGESKDDFLTRARRAVEGLAQQAEETA